MKKISKQANFTFRALLLGISIAVLGVWAFSLAACGNGTTDAGSSTITPSGPTSVAVTGVSLKSSTYILVGNTETLNATITPSNATNQNVTWRSSNSAVATVSTSGKVTAIAKGTATITVTSVEGGKSASCIVTVAAESVPVTGVSLNKSSISLNVGGIEDLTTTIMPSNATNQNVTWYSSNTRVATVSDGTVTAVAAGSATITVTTIDGNKTASSNVTITLAIPATPTGVTASAGSATSITVSWSSVTGATGYKVYRSSSASGTYSKVGDATTTSYTDTGLTANTTYYYKVSASNNAGESSQSSSVSAKTSESIPAVPSDFWVSAVSSTSVTVRWSSVTGATGYKVYRSTSSSGTYSKVGDATTTSYTDTGLTANTTYYYKVSASNSAGESSQSSSVSAKAESIPETPTDLTAEATSSSSIWVSWSSVTGATHYTVYRSSSSSGTYSNVDNITSTSCSNTGLTANTTYYYKVSAHNSAGESAQSSSVSAKTSASVSKPDAPTGVTASAESSSSIKVSWSSSTGATGYKVYRSSSSSGTYSSVGDVTTTSYTDTGLTANTTYYYKVSAHNSAGESAQSSSVSAKTSISISIPATPTGVSASAESSTSIKVSWSSVTGATGYKVYRSSSSSGTYSKVGDATTTSYTDTGLTANTTYYYKVSATNSAGESAQSSAVSAKTSASISIPATPTSVSASAESSSSITVSWSSVTGATGYKVYRSASSSGTYSSVGNVTYPSYTDTGLTANTTYYYKVSAYNSAGESAQSSAVSAKTPEAIITKPTRPSNVSASPESSSSIKVSWSPVTGATSYKVYCRSDYFFGFEWVGGTTTTSFTHTGLTEYSIYQYEVIACNSAGESAGSLYVETTAQDPPGYAGGISWNVYTAIATYSEGTPSGIFVDWSKTSSIGTMYTGFRFYRSENYFGPYTKIDGVSGDIHGFGASGTWFFIDNDVIPGKTYYYRLIAITSNGDKSNMSYPVSETFPR
jgi:fibronectin type 3 domain-containing protein